MFAHRHPRGGETLLAVEIASRPDAMDRRKLSIYARAGVGECWLVDLRRRRVEVHSGPLPSGRWASTRVARPGESVRVPGTAHDVAVADLLP